MKLSPGGQLVGEVRHLERKTVEFFCLDQHSGAVLWEHAAFDEPWWIGIEEVLAGRIYFHRYRKPDMPQHAGVIAVDILTGETLWEHRDGTYAFAFGDEVYVTRQGFETLRFTALDAGDGAPKREMPADDPRILAMRAELGAVDAFAGYAWPEPLDAMHPDWHAHSPLLAPHVDVAKVRGTLDVLARHDMLLASWHESTGREGFLDQHFLAVERPSGAVLFRDVLAADVQASTIDSFFVKDDLVLYVKNTDTLTAHTLPSATAS